MTDKKDAIQPEDQDLVKRILATFNAIAIVALLFNVLLLLDRALPGVAIPQQVISISEVIEKTGPITEHINDRMVLEDYTLIFEPNSVTDGAFSKQAVVRAGRILKKATAVEITVGNTTLSFPVATGLHALSIYLMIGSFVALTTYFLLPKPDHRLTIAITILLLVGIELFLLFQT